MAGTVGAAARAETSRFYELEGFGHFLDGNPETTGVTEDGSVVLPPTSRERFSDATATFTAAAAQGDDVVVARVEDAQVLAINAAGKARMIYKPAEGAVTALCDTPDGLLVAVGVPAKIYRIGKNGEAKVYHAPQANYVWGMAVGPKNSVYAVTGEPGTVLKITAAGQSKVLFRPDQSHLRSIAYDGKLGIFVGGGEHGVLYRALPTAEEAFTALYDTGNPEITSIALQDDSAFVAGVSGAALLVQEDPGAKHGSGKPLDVHSQVMRITMDGAAEVLAGSNDEAVFALAADKQKNILVATGGTGRDDPRGRLYSINPERRVISMLFQSPSRRLTHLVALKTQGIAAVGAAGGRITEFSHALAPTGEFFTQPFDAGVNATFGAIQTLGVFPKDTAAQVALRSGQTADPDASWSAWSSNVPAATMAATKVPNGRYLQARLTLKSSGDASPAVQRVRVAYLRQNLPPFVREVSTLRKGLALAALPRDDNRVKVVALSDKPEEAHPEEPPHHGGSGRARQAPERGALTIRWVADDPNGDELRYDLLVRSAREATWRLLKGDLIDPFYVLQSSQLPDGYYVFRVSASDALANPLGMERTDSRDSRAILIDNTAPELSVKVVPKGQKAEVRLQVKDAMGPLLEWAYALDGGDFRPILPDDGVLDGPQEVAILTLPKMPSGSHSLTVRAIDEADNEGVADAHFDIRP